MINILFKTFANNISNEMRLMENEAQTAKFYKTFNIKSNMS